MILRALIPAAAAFLLAAPAQAAQVTITDTTVGESGFVVPAGVHSIDVALTGTRGGSGPGWPPGGLGAAVSGTLTVYPGMQLYAEVGGAGTDWSSSAVALPGGGFNGGGSGAGGGGGATDLRAAPAAATSSLHTRLAVAGGGGGAGWAGLYRRAGGGDAGMTGRGLDGSTGGGRPGTQIAGGNGGTGGESGGAGGLGLGGDGGHGIGVSGAGGGGGGGLYGGGGGNGSPGCSGCPLVGGGGGGSSLVPPGGTSGLAARGAAASVTIAYERAEAAASTSLLEFPAARAGMVGASREFELENTASSTDLVVNGLSVGSDDFIVGASTCFGPIVPGAKCAIRVHFTPSAEGDRTSTLRVDTNAGPLNIALSGEGSKATASVTPTTATVPAACWTGCSG